MSDPSLNLLVTPHQSFCYYCYSYYNFYHYYHYHYDYYFYVYYYFCFYVFYDYVRFCGLRVNPRPSCLLFFFRSESESDCHAAPVFLFRLVRGGNAHNGCRGGAESNRGKKRMYI